MKMQVYIDDLFMEVFLEDGVLFLKWKSSTRNLTNDLFKKEAKKFVNVVKDSKSNRIIVDMRDFGYSLTEDDIAWRKDNVIKAYNQMRVKRFAFIELTPKVKQDDPKNTFVTKSFSDKQTAKEWNTS